MRPRLQLSHYYSDRFIWDKGSHSKEWRNGEIDLISWFREETSHIDTKSINTGRREASLHFTYQLQGNEEHICTLSSSFHPSTTNKNLFVGGYLLKIAFSMNVRVYPKGSYIGYKCLKPFMASHWRLGSCGFCGLTMNALSKWIRWSTIYLEASKHKY